MCEIVPWARMRNPLSCEPYPQPLRGRDSCHTIFQVETHLNKHNVHCNAIDISYTTPQQLFLTALKPPPSSSYIHMYAAASTCHYGFWINQHIQWQSNTTGRVSTETEAPQSTHSNNNRRGIIIQGGIINTATTEQRWWRKRQ